MRTVSVLISALLLMAPVLLKSQSTLRNADATTIACRALEAHTDDALKVTVVVFHQRDDAERSQLAALLREHSGEMVEVQGSDGGWHRARMVRMRSCFGRGLLMLAAPTPFPERAEFALRLPAK